MGEAKSNAKTASGDLWQALYGTGAEAYPYAMRLGEYGEDQLQKYYNMLQGSLDTYNSMLSREQETYDRYKSIWGGVEQAQAGDALADIQGYRPVKDAAYKANLDTINRRSLYYPLEEQTIASAQDELALSQDSRDRYRTYAPSLIETLVSSADNVDPTLMGSMAANDIASTLTGQRDASNRNMARMGINPNSAKFADVNANADINAAAQMGAAKTRGRIEGEGIKLQRTGQALSALTPTSSTGTAAGVGNAGLSRSLINVNSTTPDLLSATRSYSGSPTSYKTDFNSLLGSGMTGLNSPLNYYTGQQKTVLDFYKSLGDMQRNASEKETDSSSGWGSAIGGGLSAVGSIAALVM